MSSDKPKLNIVWHKCKECQHMKYYECDGRVYCNQQPNNACLYKFKRIRRNDNICPLFILK
jgi:hypothetical protein